jgi:hypothetical protein
MNIFRHLKWNERKFNGTLNDTRFGLKARVSSSIKDRYLISLNILGSSSTYCIEIIRRFEKR